MLGIHLYGLCAALLRHEYERRAITNHILTTEERYLRDKILLGGEWGVIVVMRAHLNISLPTKSETGVTSKAYITVCMGAII